MTQDNSTESLKELKEDVLREIIREAEVMMQAQVVTHLASDQRGFTFGGLALTAGTGALGGAIALMKAQQPDANVALVAGFAAIGLILSGSIAIASALPRQICLPGNEPKNWKPEHWPPGAPRSTKQVRLEQAKVLQSQISSNRLTAKFKARMQLISFVISYLTCAICGIWLAFVL